MPSKHRTFERVKFPPEILAESYKKFVNFLEEKENKSYSDNYSVRINKSEYWEMDNESEFFEEYRKDIRGASYTHQHHSKGNKGYAGFYLDFEKSSYESKISIRLPDRQQVEAVLEIFEANYAKYKVSDEEFKKVFKIFIGHGRTSDWKEIKDHLHDKHDFNVIAYETGARAGYTITEVLEEMSSQASFALLVLTAEDTSNDGKMHARENVIHETGLFQGKLGFKKAIILLEEGCNEFTNISGVQQLRFSKNAIKETFGDILATISRESKLKSVH